MPAPHPPQLKAQALARMATGAGTGEVAQELGIPASTISCWRAEVPELTRQHQIGARLLDYLDENLSTLSAQAVAFRDPAWLAKQRADSVAILHGVMADKMARILEAMAPPAGEDEYEIPDISGGRTGTGG